MSTNKKGPERVANPKLFWGDPPDPHSARCDWWLERIRNGWRRNRRLKTWGYEESAEYFGVYIREWVNVLLPALKIVETTGEPNPKAKTMVLKPNVEEILSKLSIEEIEDLIRVIKCFGVPGEAQKSLELLVKEKERRLNKE